MKSKFIFFDCDGTTIDVPRGLLEISNKTRYAINELIKNGHHVFVASGRPTCLIPSYLKEIKGLNFVTCNGSFSYLCDGTIIAEHKFSRNLVKQINEYCLMHDCLYFDETADIIYTPNKNDSLFKDFVEGWNVDSNVFKNGEEVDNCYMMMAAFRNKKMSNDFYENFKGVVNAAPQYGFESCDINLNGISKGTGVNDVLSYYNVDPKDAYAFGDGLNDIEMLSSVKNGYRMANGNPALEDVTNLVAPDVLEDGFYQIMVKEGLIKPLN